MSSHEATTLLGRHARGFAQAEQQVAG